MTIHLFAQGNRATSITTLAVLGVMALLIAPSTPARAADARPTPVLAQGAGMGAHPSLQVRVVQRALDRRGYDLGAPGVDGRFGPLTEAALRQMQADYGLAIDGIVGRHTRKALGIPRHGRTQAPSTAKHRSKAVHERPPASARDVNGPTAADPTASPNASAEGGYSAGGWFDWFVAGALAGLISLLLAIAVATKRRKRDRAQAMRTVSTPALANEVPPRTDNGRAREQTIPLAHNGNAGGRRSPSAGTLQSPPPPLGPGARVIGYITVSADSRTSDDDGSAAAIEASCERCEWELLEIVRDRDTGVTLERPALGYALKRIAERQAAALVVTDLRRLSRSIVDLGALMAWFRDAQATLVALDLDINTSTRTGQQVASTLIALSAHRHERIAQRTRQGVTEARNGGRANGRPAVRHDREFLERIAGMRAANMTLQAIADRLNAEGVPTLRGGAKWRPSSIQSALGYRRPAPRDHLPSLERRRTRT
jgi:DNA invertase Pin-like site-specific DNA recombinase/peptidoglycan hydrolase-like protein with peptidoglycan-binding domain